MKRIAFLILPLIFLVKPGNAQKFTLQSDTTGIGEMVYSASLVLLENTLDEWGVESIVALKPSGKGFKATLENKRPVFAQLYWAYLLAVPNDTLDVLLKNNPVEV